MNRLISNLTNAADLSSAGELLKELDDFLEDNPTNRSAFCKLLSAAMCEQVGMIMDSNTLDNKHYVLYPPSSSIPLYMMANGLATGKVRDTRTSIRKQIEYIDRYVVAPSGNCLTTEREDEVLKILAAKFPYFEIVAKRHPLTILNLDSTDRRYNAMCTVGGLGKDSLILMYHMKDSETSPEYVFLHELGHALQIALAGVPREFLKFQSTFPNKLKPGDPIAADVFADAFAIAVMRGTALQQHLPFAPEELAGVRIDRFVEGLFKKYYKV